MTCSGVHREFQHKCKGISMSKWSPEEVKAIENGGNEKDQAIWLGAWDPAKFPKPAPGDLEKIRKFMQMKYVERRWYVNPEKASSGLTAQASVPPNHSQQASQVSGLLWVGWIVSLLICVDFTAASCSCLTNSREACCAGCVEWEFQCVSVT